MTDAASPRTREQAIALLKGGFDKALQMVVAHQIKTFADRNLRGAIQDCEGFVRLGWCDPT
jgi:hypothetical protein